MAKTKVSIKDNARYVEDNSKISKKTLSKTWYLKSKNEETAILIDDKNSAEIEVYLKDINFNETNNSEEKKTETKGQSFKTGTKVVLNKNVSEYANGMQIPNYIKTMPSLYVIKSDALLTEIGDKKGNPLGTCFTYDLKIKK